MIIKAAEGVDVIMDFVMPWMAPYVLEAALAVEANYVNSAFDAPFWDQLIAGESLSYHKEFETIGKTALLGCGQTPGFINVRIKIRMATRDMTYDQYSGNTPMKRLICCQPPSVRVYDTAILNTKCNIRPRHL